MTKTEQTEETGWLIELDVEGEIMWLQVLGHGKVLWTKNAIDATRMARREDAEGIRAHFLGNHGTVTEHAWG